MDTAWHHVKTLVDGEDFEIDGLNIWKYKWEDTGETIRIKDPIYQQEHCLSIFRINETNFDIEFAAGEFSNCVWGIYIKKP